ncbi:MAG: TonB C-terminal domain-containing protein [Gemmatimonadetes bacterium]|nr:TonB C-terminal domain-containing protein [Gemmatimonadota bacterium]
MILRRRGELPRQAIAVGAAGTALVHLAAVVTLVAAATRRPMSQVAVYAVELTAAPLARSRPVAPPAPPPPPTAPAPAPTRPKPVAKKPDPTPKPPAKVDPKTEPAKPAAATNVPAAGETPSTGTDVANVKTEGIPFPYPEYLRQLTNEILRRWSRPLGAAALEAEVSFTIHRDGRVTDIQVARSSRSYSFDLGARGAVEQAGEDLAFGPLPKGWQSDILKVAFLFTPRSR